MNEVLAYLRDELAKRTAPWWGKDRLGNEGMQPPLCTAVVLMPNQVKELLQGIDGPVYKIDPASGRLTTTCRVPHHKHEPCHNCDDPEG